MRLSSCIGSWLKWLHKAGGMWERWCRDSIFLPAHNCTMIIQCEHISPSSAHVSISAFDWCSSVLCISHLMSLYMLIRMVFFALLTMTTDAFADVFWRTHCLKMETRTVTPDGKQWVRGRRRLKEWQECNNHKKAKRWQDKNREKQKRKEKVWIETVEMKKWQSKQL